MGIIFNDSENFTDTDEFIDCFNRGCELVFIYGDRRYSAVPANGCFHVWEVGNKDSKTNYGTAEALLDYPIGDKRLRDILKDMKILERTLY